MSTRPTYDDPEKVIGELRSELALKDRELEKFKRFVERSQDVIYRFEIDTRRFVLYNQAGYELYGPRDGKDVTAQTVLLSVHPEDRDRIRKAAQESLASDRSGGEVEYRQVGADGSSRLMHDRWNVIRNESGRPIAFEGIVRDVTERKRAEAERSRLESQLRQAQKMEAIGTLAGGIAHDFNNILAAMIGYTELALDDIHEASEARGNLEQVLHSGFRAKKLVQQILSFGRRTDPERKAVKIGPVIEEGMMLLRASLPTTIEIEEEVEDKTGTVSADVTQIHQLLMNLCTNAAHAMRERGGVLTVRLDRVDLGEDAAAGCVELSPGAYIRLIVRDTGEGMAADIADRVFEPFFTTKKTGEGTGMGLAVVHGIVKSHGGTITVHSEPGRGSLFRVYLPLLEAEASETGPASRQPVPKGSEHILFVDDEKAIADIGKRMLERLGYVVTCRTSSPEALQVFRADPHRFQLVITDQTMPKMTGVDLAKELLEIRPDIPIIICTGFSTRISHQSAEELGVKRVLMKPLAARETAEAIREVLDEK